jgi:hypothetical protein
VFSSRADASADRKVWASFLFLNPTVPLDHSSYVADVSCAKQSTEMTLKLKDYTSFKIVQDWEHQLPIILTGHRLEGCFPADERADRFWAE